MDKYIISINDKLWLKELCSPNYVLQDYPETALTYIKIGDAMKVAGMLNEMVGYPIAKIQKI